MFDLKLKKNADPYFGWTPEKTEEYIIARPLKAGDKMLIVNTQAGFEEYVLATVVNQDTGRQHRVVLDTASAWGGTSFYRSGKNCFSPKGKSKMIPPVPEVLEVIATTPSGKFVLSNRRHGTPLLNTHPTKNL